MLREAAANTPVSGPSGHSPAIPPGAPDPPFSLCSRVHGDTGPHLLLIHGFGTNGHTWDRWLPSLSEDHRVHLIDLKGFGASPKPRDRAYSPLDQAFLVKEWIIREGLGNLTLVGHSVGGGVALLSAVMLMEEDPGRIRGLVLIASTGYPQAISPYLRVLGRPVLGPIALRVLPKRVVVRVAMRRAYHFPDRVSEELVEAYARPLLRANGRYALSRSAAQLVPPGITTLSSRYGEVGNPCLLLWGSHDPVVPLWVGQKLAGTLPNARLEILPECGHMPQEEEPEAALGKVRDFLGGLPGEPGSF
jgi:pimeloyl-ACP methyl ester carboxylesterase